MIIPLFPLNAVIFPEGLMQMRIFEPRYLDLVSECLRTDTGFGVCLISSGHEAGSPAEFHATGTYVKIIDWDKLNDGLLGITVKGERRFKVLSSNIRANKLIEAEIAWVNEIHKSLPDCYQAFSDLLQKIANRHELPFDTSAEKFMKADWVSCRLAELLPFELDVKQELLEMDNPLSRFDYMQNLLEQIDTDSLQIQG